MIASKSLLPIARALALVLSLSLCSCAPEHEGPTPDRESKRLSLAKVWRTENSQCEIPGNAANWQGAYCLWLNKTTDFEKDEVKSCYETLTAHQGIPKSICERNQYFKREICKTLVLDRYFKTLEQCMSSDDSVPVAVREGL